MNADNVTSKEVVISYDEIIKILSESIKEIKRISIFKQ